ncbi:C45 family autoproteolytic acyltransferase/hydrolase [Saccharopolyspora spinosporotrichia]
MSLPVHRSDELDPAQRGRGFGRAWRKQVQRSYAGYAELFAAVGASDVRGWSEQAHAETAAWAPALAEEIADVAEGCGLPTWQVAALNARTEILAAAASNGEGECSTSVVLPGAGVAPRTVQTWDWHDTLADGMVIWSLEPRAGHRVHTFTEFGVLGKIGVNSAGLGVHFNVLRHVRDSADIGVPVHVVARRILDEASTVGEAVAIAGSARLSASSLITVATFDGERGEVRGLELSPAGVAGLEPDGTGTFLHTNHFLDVELSAGSGPPKRSRAPTSGTPCCGSARTPFPPTTRPPAPAPCTRTTPTAHRCAPTPTRRCRHTGAGRRWRRSPSTWPPPGSASTRAAPAASRRRAGSGRLERPSRDEESAADRDTPQWIEDDIRFGRAVFRANLVLDLSARPRSPGGPP